MDYQIISQAHLGIASAEACSLEASVRRAIADGWVPLEGPTAGKYGLFQAMTREMQADRDVQWRQQ